MRLYLLPLLAIPALAADPDGAALFNTKCAACHTQTPVANTGDRAPSRGELAAMTPEQIIDALVKGRMQIQARGMTQPEVTALAVSVTGKAIGSTTASTAGTCAGVKTKPFVPATGDWNGWGMDNSNSRYQPKPGLSAQDVPKLKLKWAFGFPGDTRAVAQPTVVGGRVFLGSYSGLVYSLDAETGCVQWTYNVGTIARTGIVIAKGVAYFGDSSAYAHAVDAQTGKGLWKVKLDEHPLARITGSPVYYDGRVYVPVSSGEELGSGAAKYECCTFRGSLVALDGSSGKQLWKTSTIPDPPKNYKTNPDGTKLYGPAGGGLWSAPTIDEKNKRIYIGSGNSYTNIDVPTSDAILAFDLATGSMLWSSQVTPKDNWIPGCPKSPLCPENPGEDFDFAGSVILRTLANGKQIILAGQKSGIVYGLDPDARGKVLWQTRVGQGGGLLGGVDWGMASEGNTVYAAVADPNRPDGTPGLYAINMTTGAKLWGTPSPEEGRGKPQPAAVTAIPGVVFSGSFGGHMRAYSSQDGKILWDYAAAHEYETVNKVPAKGGTFNGGGPAIVNGMVFANCGYGFAGGVPGNVLLAFSVN